MMSVFRRNFACRVSIDFQYCGMRTAVLENERLRVSLLLDKGAEIFEFLYKPADVDFMYLAPWGVKNPRLDVPSAAAPGAFLDYYSGGWQEILPNGGAPSTVRGAAYGQHGDISLIPWTAAVVEDSPDRVAVLLSVRSSRAPLYLEKELSLERGRPVLWIKEKLVNESPTPIEFMWGHHVAFGGLLLKPGTRIDLPAKKLIVHGEIPGFGPRRLRVGEESAWPHGVAATGETIDVSVIPPLSGEGFEEMMYVTELQEGWYAVTQPEKRVGFALRWEKELFPYVWFWQEFGGGKDYPWWGRVHTFALEPWTSYPTDGLEQAMLRGTAARLEGGASIETSLCAVAYEGFARVTRVSEDGFVQGE